MEIILFYYKNKNRKFLLVFPFFFKFCYLFQNFLKYLLVFCVCAVVLRKILFKIDILKLRPEMGHVSNLF